MTRINIPIGDWQIKPHDLLDNQWLLLTSGDFSSRDFNCMTVSWGSFGTMWNRPFALIAVRNHRYTYRFIEKYDSFTLSAFPKTFHNTLNTLGTKSGREMDKINHSGLTPIASQTVNSPAFEEAELIVECKKMYWQDLDPKNFLTQFIAPMYPKEDYSRIYYGEITAVMGETKYKG